MKILNYEIEKYSFNAMIAKIFNTQDLTRLHIDREDLVCTDDRPWPYSESDTKFHKTFYESLQTHEEIKQTYFKFIQNEVAHVMSEDTFLFQKFPTFRVALPNTKAVNTWHYDSDDDHGHPDWEINFQIAVTDMIGNQATWIESIPGLGDYAPMEMKQGQFSIFYGNKCKHGNKCNDTTATRVSLDFRVMPLSKYLLNLSKGSIGESAIAERKFEPGGYYYVYMAGDGILPRYCP